MLFRSRKVEQQNNTVQFSTVTSIPRTESVRSLKPISVSEISHQWQHVVNEIQKERRWVGTALAESRIVKCDDGLVTLGCTNKAFISSLKQNQDLVSTALEKIYGMKFRLETIMIEHEKTDQENVKLKKEEHSLVQLIKRELGAVELS